MSEENRNQTGTETAVRTINDLPLFTEIDDPDFGFDWDWIANDLCRREYQGLLRHDALGVIVYRNADISALGTHKAVSHQAVVEGFQDALMEYSTFGMRPPQHRPAKNLVSRQVSSRSLQRFVELAREVTDEMVTTVVDRGEVDFLGEFVLPLLARFWSPVLGASIAEIERIQALIDELQLAFSLQPTEEEFARSEVASEKYLALVTEVVERGIADGRHEIYFGLVDDYEKMDAQSRPRNVASHFGVALIDAFNTAGALAANAVQCVIESPEHYAAVKRDRSLVPEVWNEAARMRPPVIATQRATVEDIVYDGVLLPAETPLTMMWAFGNRDPEVFSNPNEYQLNREKRALQTNFGVGFYACLGRHVAKLIGETVVAAMTDPALEVESTKPVEYSRGSLVQEPLRMMVSIRSVR